RLASEHDCNASAAAKALPSTGETWSRSGNTANAAAGTCFGWLTIATVTGRHAGLGTASAGHALARRRRSGGSVLAGVGDARHRRRVVAVTAAVAVVV